MGRLLAYCQSNPDNVRRTVFAVAFAVAAGLVGFLTTGGDWRYGFVAFSTALCPGLHRSEP